jgi:hypothetical protein
MTTSGGHITDDELKKFSDFLSQIKLKWKMWVLPTSF